ncbi:MAG TPA: ABC transporter substrate-binding protein [Gemmatimonadales bacterium]|nr:ABC transporter substrate-binding protein [Gemmatimonadales bacterium]
MSRARCAFLSALAVVFTGACGDAAARRGATVLFASGADLASINPLLTDHPLARQVQRYVLLTTLARYDSLLVPRPYLARAWQWSDGGRTLTFRLRTDVRWHDGVPTTARDVVWTLNAARDVATGYPRFTDLASITAVSAPNDSTIALQFAAAPRARSADALPDVFTDLAILPAHLLDSIPHARLRQAAWNLHPVGNGPFRFVTHEPNRRWVFARNADFPAGLGGPPYLERFIVVVVDDPMVKLSALVAGELDFAGISPQHVAFVRGHPPLTVCEYPLIFPYGLVFNARRPPFNDPRARLAAALAIDRREIVDGYLFGLAIPADGPVPPGLPGYVPVPVTPLNPDSARRLVAALGSPPAFELLSVGSGEAPLEQMLQARLAAVGFRVTIRQLELSTFLDRVNGTRHDFTAAVMGITGDPGLGYLQSLPARTGLPLPADPRDAQRVLAEQRPVVWLYHARGVQAMNSRIRAVRMDMRGELATVAVWRVGVGAEQ